VAERFALRVQAQEEAELSPLSHADVYATLARSYSALGRAQSAVELLERCLGEVRRLAPEDVAAEVRFASYLSYALADCMTRPTMTTAYETSQRALQRAPDVDGLYISCPQWPVIDHIETLERESGKPVVTHLSAIMWGALSRIGVRAPLSGYGKLLAEWPNWAEVEAAAA